MNIEKSDLLRVANEAYDRGEPVMTDEAFDVLADTGIGIDERNFRKKVDLVFVMGSLSKLKTPFDVGCFVRPSRILIVSPKLDGNSVELLYEDGKLVRAATRGNGNMGNDITDKVILTNAPKEIPTGGTVVARAEAVMPKTLYNRFDKRLRNIVAGALNSKEPDRELLALVDFVVFDVVIPGRSMTVGEKLREIERLFGKHSVQFFTMERHHASYDALKLMYDEFLQVYSYDIDGIVIERCSDLTNTAEAPKMTPSNKVAVKFPGETADAVVARVEWSLGKHARITPVVVFEDSVELAGASIRRATGHNAALLAAAGIGPGAVVTVVRSGDVIPYISGVAKKTDAEFEMPKCPECGSDSVWDANSVHVLCPSSDCPGKRLVWMKNFFGVLDADFVSDATVEAFFRSRYTTPSEVFNAPAEELVCIDGFGESTVANVLTIPSRRKLTQVDLLRMAGIPGISIRNAERLVARYGTAEKVAEAARNGGIDRNIDGFGAKLCEAVEQNADLVDFAIAEARASGFTILEPEDDPDATAQKTVCVTGTWSGGTRKVLKEKLAKLGWKMVGSVTKDTDLLLCADPDSGSGKVKKAKKLGVKIMTYDEFFASEGR